MSTIKAANVQNTGSGAPTFKNSSGTEIGQLAKAWVNFNGSGTVAIRESFNISSLADNGTGDYTISFTNSFSNTDYCVVTGGYNTFAGDGSFNVVGNAASANYPAGLATGSVRMNTYTNTGNTQDQQAVYVAIFGA
jgi:hypothetical protein|tara:strand:+ start:262 stop:669 length:408 start_codon:yes stop_codon:yes gene_type:complete